LKKAIGLVLLICIVGALIYFSLTAQRQGLADAAIFALLGFGLLAVTFFLKKAKKTQ